MDRPASLSKEVQNMVEEPRGPAVREPEVVVEERYPPPPPSPPPQRTSSLALASLATGIAAWFIFPFFGAIAAVITGALALDEIRESGGRVTGSPYATAGIVLGGIQLGLIVIGAILLAIFAGAVFRIGAVPMALLMSLPAAL